MPRTVYLSTSSPSGRNEVDEPVFGFGNPASSGDNVLESAKTGRRIRVMTMMLLNNDDTAVNTVQFKSSGGADISPPFKLAKNGGWTQNNSEIGLFQTERGEGLDINLTNGGDVAVMYTYKLV